MIRSPLSKEIRKDFYIHSPFPIPNSQFNEIPFCRYELTNYKITGSYPYYTAKARGPRAVSCRQRPRAIGVPPEDQPFTAPATIPLMIWPLKAKYMTTMGAMVMSMAAICLG